MKVYDTALMQIIQDSKLTTVTLRVLLYIMGKADYDNIARMGQADIASAIGASRQQVSTALSTLHAQGYVIVNTTRRPGFYKISESVAQRGTKTVKV